MRTLYLLSRCFSSPLEAIFTFLIFIVTKELGATPLQLSVLACSKPTVSLASAYMNHFLLRNPEFIKSFLLSCNLIGLLPCLFFPSVENVWFFIASYAVFIFTLRASYPAWIEILKCTLEIKQLPVTVASGSSINYFVLTFFPFIFTYFLDKDSTIWKSLFVGTAILQLSFFIILLFIPSHFMRINKEQKNLDVENKRNFIKQSFFVLWNNPDFAKYQILFFVGGAGLVAIQPILPIYFHETLHLSYTQLALGFSVCRGISFMCASPLWVTYVRKVSLYHLNAFVNIFSTLFIVSILIAMSGIEWLFVGYIMYGIMQAGCELSWNLSGPLFSKQNESISYSSLNLSIVSLRGMIFPFLGQLIYFYTHSMFLFSIAGALCLFSVLYAFVLDHKITLGERKPHGIT